MINIRELFLSTMLDEIGNAYQNGIDLRTPKTYALKQQEIKNTLNFNLPLSLINFYNQTAKLEILWKIDETEENTKQFKEDPYLIQTYFNNDYHWGVVSDFLTGFVNITNANDILNSEFNENQAYYYTLKNNIKDENENDFFPFDIQSDITACLKKEGGTIIDNIWLIHTTAEKIYDMKLTIEEYLQLAYEAKCIYHWQLVYLYKNTAEEYEIMKKILPKIFSHVQLDLSKFGI